MGRFGAVVPAILAPLTMILLAGLAGCSGGNPVATVNFPVPASISLTPSPDSSLELGTNQAFSATLENASKGTITEPVTYVSSNPSVVTVAANGLACAGSWDSLSSPQICTPGATGVAEVRAVAQGVSSPATTVYVHQHIDKIVISTIPTIPPSPTTPCLSVGQTIEYQAHAFSNGSDITSTVGVFTWQDVNLGVASLSTTATGLQQGQVQLTAMVPGVTPVFATVGGANSIPVKFTTCAVQSITLAVTGATSSSTTITPTVIDTLGATITGVPLTWSSSQSASASVSASGLASTTTGNGGATIIASCTPPACNIGFLPAKPIYPENVVQIIANNTGTQSQSATVYATSTACGNIDTCVSAIVPLTVPANTFGNFVPLPATPNSLVFDRQGAKAYLGTDSGRLGSQGLMVLDAGSNSVTQFTSTPGKVLAVSPNGLKVIVSDTTDDPNQVFVFDTTSNTNVALRISGATAADFSPDSLKAYIVAGSTLYVYSQLDALQTIPLTAPAKDVSFLSEGAFAYLAGGDLSGVAVRRTCDNADVTDPGKPSIPAPSLIKTLPGQADLAVHGVPPDTNDTFHVLALDPPDIDIISVNTTPQGCVPTVSDGPITSFNLGHGDFVAKQMIVSQDGSAAYVVSPELNSIVVFNIRGQTVSPIGLIGEAVALQASLTPNGSFLYVGANDGTIHALQIATLSDLQQIAFPTNQSLCQDNAGQPFAITCNADLVAVKP
ncbi:MAG: hypothetical protein WB952_26370 [Terriglobales bacterium]